MNSLFQTILRLVFPHKDPSWIRRKYNIPDTINISVRITQEGYFIVTSRDLPGLVTEARNHQELIEMVNDAVLTYFDVPKREADIIYNQFNIGNQLIRYDKHLLTLRAQHQPRPGLYEGKLQTRAA